MIMNLDDIYLPIAIKNRIQGLNYKVDEIGLSNSQVYIFDDYILKISRLKFDIDNEIRVYNNLKNKLPIPDILEYEIKDGVIYLLKNKLKGKLLCDDYYMRRPDLFYKLCGEALRLLHNVDISNLDLCDSTDVIINTGLDFYHNHLIDFNTLDKEVVKEYNNFDEIFDFLIKNKPHNDMVLTHADLCLPNIICDENHIVGFIDLGLTGISNIYHDIAILYRSTKSNFNGKYGKKYAGFAENKFYTAINTKKDEDLIKYYLLLDEVLG